MLSPNSDQLGLVTVRLGGQAKVQQPLANWGGGGGGGGGGGFSREGMQACSMDEMRHPKG